MSMRRPSPPWNPISSDLSTTLILQSKEQLMETVFAACYAVAMADLEMDHGERTLLLCICEVLAVDPAAAGLVEPA